MNHWVGAEETEMNKTQSLQQDIGRDMQLKMMSQNITGPLKATLTPALPVLLTYSTTAEMYLSCPLVLTSHSFQNLGAGRVRNGILIPSFFLFPFTSKEEIRLPKTNNGICLAYWGGEWKIQKESLLQQPEYQFQMLK